MRHPLAITLFLLCACGSPDDDEAAPAPPARAVLEVVLDEADTIAPDSGVAADAGLGGLCLRGDPLSGDPWSMDGIGDTITRFELVQLPALAARDSARLAARLSRTADALPGDTLVADFRGLPVVIRDAWRLVPVEGDTTYIAIASRRLPIESNPLEEQLTVVASPDTVARGTLVARWFARSAGMEEDLETRDPVLAYRAPDGALRVLMLRERGEGHVVEMLVRIGQQWRRQWSGGIDACR